MKTIATSLTAAVAAATLALSAGAAPPELFQISMPLGGTSGTFYTQGAARADFMTSRTKLLRIVPSTSGGRPETIRLVGSDQADLFQISMPLGGTSGTFYTQGAALADFMNSRTKVLRIVPSTSGGSVENIRLVGSGQAEFGMAFDGHIYGAWNSEGVFEREYREYRQLGPAQKSSGWNFAVPADGGVNSVEDLVDKDFVPGAPGSGSASDADLFLKHIGLYDDINIAYYSWGELGRMLSDGDIDGFNRTGPAKSGWAQEIDATHPVKILDLEPQRSEEHTSELQSLMRISYAVFCLKKKKKLTTTS